eukprot:12759372-Heterocapsa_arctica.AAC.1
MSLLFVLHIEICHSRSVATRCLLAQALILILAHNDAEKFNMGSRKRSGRRLLAGTFEPTSGAKANIMPRCSSSGREHV